MSDAWEVLVHELVTQGPRQHADWDAELFSTLVKGPAQQLRLMLEAEPRRDKVAGAWLKLVAEAVGLGQLDQASAKYLLQRHGPVPESLTLVGRCLLHFAPAQLPAYPVERAVELLARTWNLCEGLAAQPLWLNRYAASVTEAPALEKLDEFLATTLAPALAPARAAAFSGPFTLAVLDTRKLSDEFLPGDMHLAAPSVLCVHDRRHEDVKLGLFLAPNGATRFLGVQACLGSGPVDKAPVPVVQKDTVKVKGHDVLLPKLSKAHRTLAASSGYVVTSAEDSQRLWVMDTP